MAPRSEATWAEARPSELGVEVVMVHTGSSGEEILHRQWKSSIFWKMSGSRSRNIWPRLSRSRYASHLQVPAHHVPPKTADFGSQESAA